MALAKPEVDGHGVEDEKEKETEKEQEEAREGESERGSLLGRLLAAGARRPSATGLAGLVVTIPFAVELLRVAAGSTPIYPDADLAVTDLQVRRAMHLQALLGPYDRFGWHHPGPALFYLFAALSFVLGSGGRTLLLGTTLVNFGAALTVVAVVGRRMGRSAALWAAIVVAGMAAVMASASPADMTPAEGPLGALVSYWGPVVVIFPVLCAVVLAAAGATGSWASLAAAAAVGSAAVQTDVGTLPLVAASLVAAMIVAAVRAARRPETASPVRSGSSTWRRRVPIGLLAWGAVAVALWVPALVQQLTVSPGNLSLLWHFFTGHHSSYPASVALGAAASVDTVPFRGMSEIMPLMLGQVVPGHLLLLVLETAVGAFAAVTGIRRRDAMLAATGGLAVLGQLVLVVAAGRVVGVLFGYLLAWGIAVPVLSVLSGGLVVVRSNAYSARRWVLAGRDLPAVALGGLAVFTAVLLLVQMVRIPNPTDFSDPDVAAAWTAIAPRLGPPGQLVSLQLKLTTTNWNALSTFSGLVDQLDAHGYRVEVASFWVVALGRRQVGDQPAPVKVLLTSLSSPPPPGLVLRGRWEDVSVTGMP